MKTFLLFVCLLGLFLGTFSQQLKDPTFEEVLSLKNTNNPRISPDGTDILFSKSSADWKENRYDSEIWLSKDGGIPIPLTRTSSGSSFGYDWSPDGKWISFLSDRGKKPQIHLISFDGGEAFPITNEKNGVKGYQWSPDGKKIAFLTGKEDKSGKERKEKYGDFNVEDNEYTFDELKLLNIEPSEWLANSLPEYLIDSVEAEQRKPQVLMSLDFVIQGLEWSPDGKNIAFTKRKNSDITSFMTADVAMVNVEKGEIKELAGGKGSQSFVDWSPDGKSFLYLKSKPDTTALFYLNPILMLKSIEGGKEKQLAEDFNEEFRQIDWSSEGIYFTALDKTFSHMYKINERSGKVSQLPVNLPRIFSFDISKNSDECVLLARENDQLNEIYILDLDNHKFRKITNSTKQISEWNYAKSEVISWNSSDGTSIEGVLHKPMNFEEGKKYPLLVVIHGGPTGIDMPSPILSYVYPVNQWLNKGAIVLRVNYRGSAGYGEEFRALNVRNLGVGDAWDVLSGVDYLVEKGMVDPDKMGCMGWSQGGYISAFLTTNTDRFKAISVGAGISNWMTYYVNTDIHPFTRQYLKANPWDDPEIYAKTSPMTNIKNASTPTLIQHGEFDKRVPIPNAYELYQGLQDQGVDAKLVVYKGFGHGISKPKERLAAIQHNWEWFLKYVWGEE